MMKCICDAIIFAVILISAGCATAPGSAPKFLQAPPAPDGFATVYFYRSGAPPYTQAIKLQMAGRPIVANIEQDYTWIYVRSGTHTAIAEWPKNLFGGGWPDASATQAFEAGKAYYFRIAGNVDISPGGLLSGSKYVLASILVSRTPEVGEAELTACCRYIAPALQKLE